MRKSFELLLRRACEHAPNKPVLLSGSRRTSYAEFESRSNAFAAGLLSLGLKTEDRTAIYTGNTVETAIAIAGAMKAGSVFVPIHPSVKPEKLAKLLSHVEAQTLVLPQSKTAGFESIKHRLRSTPRLIVVGENAPGSVAGAIGFERFTQDVPRDIPQAVRSADSPAAISFTSGSSGEPKGVTLSYGNLTFAAETIATYLKNTERDIILGVLPLSFTYGLTQLLTTFHAGATLVLETSFAYPAAVLHRIEKERITGFAVAPTMAAVLLQMDLSKFDLSSLRYITSAGAALPVHLVHELRSRLPHVALYSMYGQAECIRTSYLPPERVDLIPSSVGHAIEGVDASVVDENGEPVPPEVVGELIVTGPNVMLGYWKDPEGTDAVLSLDQASGHRRLRSGDLFRTDIDGNLYFVSRKDDIIITRGQKVAPAEVETVLGMHSDVAESLVYGAPDDVLGSAVKAVVRPRPGRRLTENEVKRFCFEHLEDEKVPQVVVLRETPFPQTPRGKVDRRLLIDEVEAAETDRPMDAGVPQNLREAMRLDPAAEVERIGFLLRRQVFEYLHRKGVVVGLSGGIDSSVTAALAVKALGASRVFGLFMPERESSSESLRLGRLLAESLGIETAVEEITGILDGAGAYRRRDEALRTVFPEYEAGMPFKIAVSNLLEGSPYRVFHAEVEVEPGERLRRRLPLDAYQTIVASVNFKQRSRKMLEYFHADRLRYAVAGTPNRLEYDLGFFVKNGDGAADVKPISHLYKTQVFQLAQHLEIPEEIRERTPTTDTYSLEQTQEEFFFSLPYHAMDLCLWAKDHDVPCEETAAVVGFSPEQVAWTYRDIDAKRGVARYLHETTLSMDGV